MRLVIALAAFSAIAADLTGQPAEASAGAASAATRVTATSAADTTCGFAPEGTSASLACPPGQLISGFSFATFGTFSPDSSCASALTPLPACPTTVLAQVDSSVGGKTGINTAEGKNLIGAFHQPKLVLADVDTLGTLPRRAWNEGFAEIIKHAAIQDATMLPLIREVAVGKGKLSELIARNVAIKGRIVAADEFETKGLRALLNFGHTIGHAIESCAGYGELLHGEAIALGMKAALHLSCKHTGLTSAAAGEINDLIAMFHLPTHLPATMTDAAILEKLSRDKKFEQGQIRFVLLDSIGSAHLSDVVTRQDLHEAIDHLR